MPDQHRCRGAAALKIRLLLAGVVALFSVVSFCSLRTTNPITGKTQYVGLSTQQEIALGLQAAPQMTQQFGGLLADEQAQATVDRVGHRLVERGFPQGHPFRFDFHVLADARTVNAFALPGGQIFITDALYDRLETEGQLAGVLAHEIGHVIERHGAERIAKMQLTQGLTGAAVIASYDPDNPATQASAAVAMVIGQLVNMKYGRDDELESDEWAVRLMAESGYDPHALIRVMEILAESSRGGAPPEFFSTHPNPENRIQRIRQTILRLHPDGFAEPMKP